MLPEKQAEFNAILERLKANDPTLTKVSFYSFGLDNNDAKLLADALKSNNSLYSLNLFGNQIGNEGAIALGDALKINNYLQSLVLTHNNIGDEGAAALANAFKINNSLSSLDLLCNNIGNEGAIALAVVLKSNNSLAWLNLDFGWNQIDNPNFVKLIKSFICINMNESQTYEASFPESLRHNRTSLFSLIPWDLTNFLIPCFIIGSVYKNLKEEAIKEILTPEEQQLFNETCLELNQTAKAIENYKKFVSGKDDRYKPENDLGIAYDIASGFRGIISSGRTAADAARAV